jgi:hypothetical protein
MLSILVDRITMVEKDEDVAAVSGICDDYYIRVKIWVG